MGRPSEFTPEIGDAICARLADGMTLKDICQAEGMPHRSTVQRWRASFPEFQAAYARARETGFDHMADECIQIADECDGDQPGQVQKAKLRSDVRRWMLSKLAASCYGDRVALEHSSPPDQPVRIEHSANPESLAAIASVLKEIEGTP